VPELSYRLTEHDAAEPWIIVRSEHLTVELSDVADFSEWASAAWPAPRFTVELDPGQLAPVFDRTR
jgi:hypothetical protein